MNENTQRIKSNYKTEVSFIRVFVNHWSFVTGLLGKLAGKNGDPEDSSIGINAILNAHIFEGCRVVNPEMFHTLDEAPYHNVLEGGLFQCCDLLSWIKGTYDSKELKSDKTPTGFKQPTEFTVETWMRDENYPTDWQLKKKTHWGGVKWLDAAHTGDGGDRMCAGIATFVCESKTVEEVEGPKIFIPKENSYPSVELRRFLLEKLEGPKHASSYLG